MMQRGRKTLGESRQKWSNGRITKKETDGRKTVRSIGKKEKMEEAIGTSKKRAKETKRILGASKKRAEEIGMAKLSRTSRMNIGMTGGISKKIGTKAEAKKRMAKE